MSLQPALPGHALTTLAIGAAGLHADHRWRTLVTAATIRLVLLAEAFTTDDVWDQLDSQGVTTHDNRALGAVMKAMQQCGLIEATTTFLPSSRTVNHHRPVRVWRATQVA